MSKAAVKKLHWRSHVQDSFVPLLGSSGELAVAVGGGADYGEFPFVTSAPGGGLTVGDIILEVGGTPVLGMTLGDVRGVLNSCPHPIRIKTVSPGIGERCEVYRFFTRQQCKCAQSPPASICGHDRAMTARPLLTCFISAFFCPGMGKLRLGALIRPIRPLNPACQT